MSSAGQKPAAKLLIGLIGSGIQRSLTPAMHEEEARQHGLTLFDQLINLEHEQLGAEVLPSLLRALRTIGFAGFNVTHPCKQAILPLLDELSDSARAIGAVNTVVLRDGRFIGHNTDSSGWEWAFRRAWPRADLSRVVLLGAGGAGAAIAHALLRLGARKLLILDAEPARAAALANRIEQAHRDGRVEHVTDLTAALEHARGLVHATPTGMAHSPGMPLPAALLRPDLWVSEIVYFPLETELLKAARAAGCATLDGGGMAVGQALGAFRLFTGRDADATRVERHFRQIVDGVFEGAHKRTSDNAD
jgi:shikimate dehydrogenase